MPHTPHALRCQPGKGDLTRKIAFKESRIAKTEKACERYRLKNYADHPKLNFFTKENRAQLNVKECERQIESVVVAESLNGNSQQDALSIHEDLKMNGIDDEKESDTIILTMHDKEGASSGAVYI